MQRASLAPWSAEAFRAKAAGEAGRFAGGAYGDHRWNPDASGLFPLDGLRDAAVLVPVVDRGADAGLLLTKRTDTLRAHSGQIALPGGRIDPTDGSPEAAALREAREEIALDPADVQIVGRLPDYVTGSGYRIVPVLGVVAPDAALKPNPDEVAAIFEVPLRFLMDPANHRHESLVWKGHQRFYYAMPWEDWPIWGVTAGILRMLYERLYR